MKKKIFLLVLISFILCACSKSAKVNGVEVSLGNKTRYGNVSYLIPSNMTKTKVDNSPRTYQPMVIWTLDDDESFKIEMDRISLTFSTGPVDEDITAVKEDENNYDIKESSAKYNKITWGILEYKTDSDYGKGSEYHVWYGSYDHLGIWYVYRITFENVGGNEGFEQLFMKNVKFVNN